MKLLRNKARLRSGPPLAQNQKDPHQTGSVVSFEGCFIMCGLVSNAIMLGLAGLSWVGLGWVGLGCVIHR